MPQEREGQEELGDLKETGAEETGPDGKEVNVRLVIIAAESTSRDNVRLETRIVTCVDNEDTMQEARCVAKRVRIVEDLNSFVDEEVRDKDIEGNGLDECTTQTLVIMMEIVVIMMQIVAIMNMNSMMNLNVILCIMMMCTMTMLTMRMLIVMSFLINAM